MENYQEIKKTRFIQQLSWILCLFIIPMLCHAGALEHQCAMIAKATALDDVVAEDITKRIPVSDDHKDIKKDIYTLGKVTPPLKPIPNDPPTTPPLHPNPPTSPRAQSPYSVGTPKGALSVNDMGAAIYNLKIDLPSDGGLTPEIGLAYNSQQAGYGIAGYGFNITGLSVITRGGKNLFDDGKRTGVSYTDEDNLYLDGKRLVLESGAAWKDNATYVLEGDPYTKIIFHLLNLPLFLPNWWFEVHTKDGKYYEYGRTQDAKSFTLIGTNSLMIVAWYINKVEDQHDNSIDYSYTTKNHYVYPSLITYGHNNKEGQKTQHKIEFQYQHLSENARPFAYNHITGSIDERLSSIQSYTNTELYRSYSFTYDNHSDGSVSKWTRLKSITEANGKGEQYPPITIDWNYLSSANIRTTDLAVSADNSSYYLEEECKQFFAADLTGDGVSEIIRLTPVKIYYYRYGKNYSSYGDTHVYISRSKVSPSGTVSYEEPIVYSLGPAFSMKDLSSTIGGASVMDFDGDGYNDLVIPFHEETDGYSEEKFKIISGIDVIKGITEAKVIRCPLRVVHDSPLFATFDVDGNGKDEVLYVEQQQGDAGYPCTMISYEGGTKLNTTVFHIHLPNEPRRLFTGDYNNDGLTDLILFFDGGYKIFYNQGGTLSDEKFSDAHAYEDHGFGNAWRMQQGDFDGDGLIDFVYNRTHSTTLWIAHNNGNGTFSQNFGADIGIADHDSNKDDDKFTLLAWDIDHDGLTDVMVCKAGYYHRGFPKFRNDYTNTQIRWLFSNGKELITHSWVEKNREDDAFERYIFLGDFNGDGYVELANYGSNLTTGNTADADKLHMYYNTLQTEDEGKICHIQDGMGNNYNIHYAHLTTPEVYKKASSWSYPVNSYTLPTAVVSIISQDIGSAGVAQTTYTYGDLRLHIGGKGMLGFTSITKETPIWNTKEVKTITAWDEQRWIPKEISVKNTVGNSTSEVVSKLQITPIGNTYTAFVAEKKITDLDGNTAVTTSKYNLANGYLEQETVTNDGGAMYKKVEYGGYAHIAGMWIPTKLTMTQKHCDDVIPFTDVTTYQYDSQGNILREVVHAGTPLALETQNTFDTYGNVLSSMQKGKGIVPITAYKEYDPTGRFVVKTYTQPASAVHTFTYDTWGNVLTDKDETDAGNALTTQCRYDGWGRMTEKKSPEGIRTLYSLAWDNTGNGKYYTKEHTLLRPYKTIYYDKGGLETSVETVGEGQCDITKSTKYNKQGRVEFVVTRQGRLSQHRTIHYDDRGRINGEIYSSDRNITHDYGNRSVTTTENNKTETKTFDAWGNVKQVSGTMGEVTYRYYSNGKPAEIITDGHSVLMDYDAAGNQIRLTDPDAGTITYDYAADGTLLSQTDARGIQTIQTFDELGRVASTKVGGKTINYIYGSAGRDKLRLQKKILDNNTVEYHYDKFGRIVNESRTIGDKGIYNFAYEYDQEGHIYKSVLPDNLILEYKRNCDGFVEKTFGYGRELSSLAFYNGKIHSTNFFKIAQLQQAYDNNGYLQDVRYYKNINLDRKGSLPLITGISDSLLTHGKVLPPIDAEELGSLQQSTFHKGKTYGRNTSKSTQQQSMDDSIAVVPFHDERPLGEKLALHYDRVTGNLLSRQLNSLPKDSFCYDALDRLTTVYNGKHEISRVRYTNNGNIDFKTGVGNYNYEDASHPHAVSEVENMENEIPSAPLTTKYNEWGKIETIEDEGKHLRLDFTYGPDGERWSSTLLKNGKPVQTTLYAKNYEKVIRGDSVREYYYLDKGVMVIRENNAFKSYLTFTDNLGSILAVMDEKGDKVFEASYDAWGKQTIKLNKIGLQRGYTGHEMLNDFDIINMNGRLYDPVLGRFLSPDNFVQMPDNAQSYNRYSYCLNNPLKYTDPSGEAFVIDDATIAFTIFSVASSMMQAAATGGNVWKAGAFSLLSSAASWGIGGLFSNATTTFGNELLRAGAHGLASGVLSALDNGSFTSSFIAGAVASGIGSYAKGIKLDNSIMIASTTAMGGIVAWATGGDFLQGAMQGLMIGTLNHSMHGDEGSQPVSVSVVTHEDGTYEVIVVGRRPASKFGVLTVAAGVNTVIDGIGTSLKKNAGNSTIGSNGRFYWHAANQQGFYGNQYVRTIRLSKVGSSITKWTGSIGKVLNAGQIVIGGYTDYQDYVNYGYTNGYNTIRATADVASGWAGAAAGGALGMKAGAAIGVWFGGGGILPGTIIGGAIGSIAGSFGGSWIETGAVDGLYGR